MKSTTEDLDEMAHDLARPNTIVERLGIPSPPVNPQSAPAEGQGRSPTILEGMHDLNNEGRRNSAFRSLRTEPHTVEASGNDTNNSWLDKLRETPVPGPCRSSEDSFNLDEIIRREKTLEMEFLYHLLKIFSYQNFCFGLKWNLEFADKKSPRENFMVYGFTKFDTIAAFTAQAMTMLFTQLLVSPINFVSEKLDSLLRAEANPLMLVAKVLGMLVYVPTMVMKGIALLALKVISLTLNFALRSVSTLLGLITAPVNLAFNHVNNSPTPFQELTLGLGATTSVKAAMLWAMIGAGMMTTGVLGTSAMAVLLITSAWPLAIATTAVGAGLLGGLGLYKLCTQNSEGAASLSRNLSFENPSPDSDAASDAALRPA